MGDATNTYTCIPDETARAQGAAILRVASDLHHFFDGDPDVPADFWRDVAAMEAAGRTLSVASFIPLPLTLPTGVLPTVATAAGGQPPAMAWPSATAVA